MSAYLPPGCTQQMLDRATADETREPCQTCEGTGEVVIGPANFEGRELTVVGSCPDCHGTGFETPHDYRSDNKSDDPYPAGGELEF
jgi:DnaJ-class molecular chaperone